MIDYEEIAHQCHTDDGIDHGRRHLEECLEAVIYKHEDGFIWCPITWSGGSCEKCMDILEKRLEKEEAED